MKAWFPTQPPSSALAWRLVWRLALNLVLGLNKGLHLSARPGLGGWGSAGCTCLPVLTLLVCASSLLIACRVYRLGFFARSLPARAKRIGKNIHPQAIVGFAAYHIAKGIGIGKKINAIGGQIDCF